MEIIISMLKIIMLSSLLLPLMTVVADNEAADDHECYQETRCSEDEPEIRFPFRLKDRQPPHCGYPGFELSCINTNRTAFQLPNIRTTFFVQNIYYAYRYIVLHNPADRSCDIHKQNLQSFRNLSISPFEISSINSYDDLRFWRKGKSTPGVGSTVLFNCSSNSMFSNNIMDKSNYIRCLSGYRYSVFSYYGSYDIGAGNFRWLVDGKCRKILDIQSVPWQAFLSQTFSLKWSQPNCEKCEDGGKRCRLKKDGAEAETECFKRLEKGGQSIFLEGGFITCVTIGSFIIVLVAGAIFHVYNLHKKDRESRLKIKEFLEDYNSFKPSRYAYSDIKKITDQFKEKLGQGAYGTVFKGKLSSDILVAVKILNNSTGNGEEFINEVATMGQIHHVNVVRLVGYCAEGFRRALIYEFLPNNSLEKYISQVPSSSNPSLSWETRQDIALGIAKGIEYLHQGCDQRILHFDIKPHNILLDTNFTAKISDFGLAKLCSKDQSAVSMNTARGTMGYIAPDVLSRNFGNVSYKSDVYSFGMLLLEMVGGRKNNNVTKENEDEVYYPEWIYNLLEEGEDLRILIEEEENAKIAKKLAIVGLWCIQWHPISRPTMKVVVQMLEGEEELTMPPNPFASISSSSKRKTNIPTRRVAVGLEAIAE